VFSLVSSHFFILSSLGIEILIAGNGHTKAELDGHDIARVSDGADEDATVSTLQSVQLDDCDIVRVSGGADEASTQRNLPPPSQSQDTSLDSDSGSVRCTQQLLLPKRPTQKKGEVPKAAALKPRVIKDAIDSQPRNI
jgi:hypothetical protein